jgi:dihydrofolate synthase/folylpolyglutamate synthase
VALACLEALHARGVAVPPEAARAGVASARWPGRLEEIPGTPPLLLDGAHNPAGVEVLLASLRALYPDRRIHLVFGVVGDKDRGPMMRGLFPQCTSVQLTPLETPRSLAPAAYLEEARALCADVAAWSDLPSALDAARRKAGPGDVVLCTGSLFLVGMVKARLG